MIINRTEIDGLLTISLEPIVDDRGYFARAFCLKEISSFKDNLKIVQINQTMTKEKGTVRGMHYQVPPACETKIVRCISGAVFDVAVDLREGSKTFLKWHGEILSAENMKMLLIPEGFAHGFQTLDDNCEMLYLHSEFYQKGYEAGVRFDDPAIAINWMLPAKGISERDLNHPLINSSFRGVKI